MGKDKATGGKAAAAKAAKEAKEIADAKAKGVEQMECRHILVEKHGRAAEIIEIINSGEQPNAAQARTGGRQATPTQATHWGVITTGKMGFNEAAREFSMDKAGKRSHPARHS